MSIICFIFIISDVNNNLLSRVRTHIPGNYARNPKPDGQLQEGQ